MNFKIGIIVKMNIISEKWVEHRVSTPGRHNFLPYYTTSPWSADESYFVFYSVLPDFSRVWLGTYAITGGETIERELSSWNGRAARIDAESGPRHDCGGRVVEEELLASVFLPEQEKMLIPRGNELRLVSLNDGSDVRCYQYGDEEFRIGGPGTLSLDGRYVAFGLYRPNWGTPNCSRMVVLDTRDWSETSSFDFGEFFANHFQFTERPDWMIYAHEGPTENIADRVNLLNWRTGERKLLHAHVRDEKTGRILECIGHEKAAGPVVAAVRYPVSDLPGGMMILNFNGGSRLADADDYWHCSGTPDGRIFTLDTMWWGHSRRRKENQMDIILLNLPDGTKQILRTIHSNPERQFRHPHPQPNRDGTRVLFIQNARDCQDHASIGLLVRKSE